MTGCIIFCTSIIGLDAGVGLNIHVRIVLCSCIGQGAFIDETHDRQSTPSSPPPPHRCKRATCT